MTTAHRVSAATGRSRKALAGLALSLLALAGTPVSAVGVVEQAAGGPPEWVVAGTRITHYASVATIASGGYELIEDPNGPLHDPVTGKRYRESFTSNGQATGGTGSGDGFWEVTVAARDGDDVLLSRVMFVNEPLTGTRSVGSSTGERVAGARVNGVWIRPDLLATMKTGDLGSVLVLRGEVSVGGKPYQAVSLVDPTAGAYSFFAYDSVTGVQLFSALRTSAIAGGPLEMSLTELRSVRQLTVPGIGAAVPDWVARHPELVYAGTQEFVNPMDPSSAPMTSRVSWRTKLAQSGATWALFETTGTVDMMGTPIPLSSSGVIGGAGPYWWDPTALAGMSGGQVLDTDPWTGLTVTVSQTAQGPAGPAVAIVQSMPGVQSEAHYDVGTGVMLGQVVSVTSSGITTRIELQQMP